jgi:hypothetical protein
MIRASGRLPMSDFRLISAGDLPVAPSKSSIFGTVVHARRNAPDDARKSDHGLKYVLTCNLKPATSFSEQIQSKLVKSIIRIQCTNGKVKALESNPFTVQRSGLKR